MTINNCHITYDRGKIGLVFFSGTEEVFFIKFCATGSNAAPFFVLLLFLFCDTNLSNEKKTVLSFDVLQHWIQKEKYFVLGKKCIICRPCFKYNFFFSVGFLNCKPLKQLVPLIMFTFQNRQDSSI